MLRLLQAFLKAKGYEVETCDSGESALQYLQKQAAQPDSFRY